jgi:hypothetical protein
VEKEKIMNTNEWKENREENFVHVFRKFIGWKILGKGVEILRNLR